MKRSYRRLAAGLVRNHLLLLSSSNCKGSFWYYQIGMLCARDVESRNPIFIVQINRVVFYFEWKIDLWIKLQFLRTLCQDNITFYIFRLLVIWHWHLEYYWLNIAWMKHCYTCLSSPSFSLAKTSHQYDVYDICILISFMFEYWYFSSHKLKSESW